MSISETPDEGPVSPKPRLTMPRAHVDELLSRPIPGVLTTIGPDGFPHSVGMWFLYEGERVRLFAYAKSQKVRNLERDPRAAFLVEQGEPYADLRGVLVRGNARVITDYEQILEIGRGLYVRYLQPRTGVAYEDGPYITVMRQSIKRVGIEIPLERVISWDHARSG